MGGGKANSQFITVFRHPFINFAFALSRPNRHRSNRLCLQLITEHIQIDQILFDFRRKIRISDLCVKLDVGAEKQGRGCFFMTTGRRDFDATYELTESSGDVILR